MTIKQLVKTATYIFPPRPQDAFPFSEAHILHNNTWEAQLKYNDTRLCLKYLPDGEIQLWNRHAERIRNWTCPDEIIDQIKAVPALLGLNWPGEYHLLDGGILDGKHVAIKDTIVIWDILVRNGEQLIGTTYNQRYFMLFNGAPVTPWMYSHPSHAPIRFGSAITPNIFYPQMIVWEDWARTWGEIITVVNAPYTVTKPKYDCKPVIEGLVFKEMTGKLGYGFKEKNNMHWLMRSRVETGRHLF